MAGFNRIGEILISKGLVTKAQLMLALEERHGSYFRIGEILEAKGLVSNDDILDCLAMQYNYPVVDLYRTHPSQEAITMLDIELWHARPMLPICLRGRTLTCAVPDPFDTDFHQTLKEQFGIELEFVFAKATEIREALMAYSIRTQSLEAKAGLPTI